jgi:hypothetical protein
MYVTKDERTSAAVARVDIVKHPPRAAALPFQAAGMASLHTWQPCLDYQGVRQCTISLEHACDVVASDVDFFVPEAVRSGMRLRSVRRYLISNGVK